MKEPLLLLTVVMLLGACASPTPEAMPTPVPTSIPAPTDTSVPLATPTSPAVTEPDFIEPIRKQIFNELLDDKGSIAGEEVRAATAQRWGISVDAAKEIVAEGIEKGWLPTATPQSVATSMSIPATIAPLPTVLSLTIEEESYLADLRIVAVGWLTAYFELERLVVEELGEDPQLLLDQGWQSHVGALFSIMRSAGQAMRELDPPARFEGIHLALMRACGQSDRAADLFAQGMNNADVDKIGEGWVEMMLGKRYIEEEMAKLKLKEGN